MTVWIQNPFDNLPTEGYRKQRYWLMAEAFCRAGHRVVLWTTDFNHTTKATRKVEKNATRTGPSVRMVPTLPYSTNVCLARVRSHRAYAREWERLALETGECPDLLVTSLPTVCGAEATLRFGRKVGARVIVDVQDAWPETFERLAPHGLGRVARLLLSGVRRRAQRLYRTADLVSGVCDRYRELTGRDDYRRAYLGVEKVEWVEKVERVGGTPRLLYAGNLGVSYDLGTVIRGLGDRQLEIAGKGDCEARWKDLVVKLGLQSQVTFHGYLDETDLRRLMASCDIGVVPMHDESFVGVPNKFCEYAAGGLRIVSSLGGESAELLRRYGCGATYAPGDPVGFSAAVGSVLSLPYAASFELARNEFDAVRIYDEYVTWCT